MYDLSTTPKPETLESKDLDALEAGEDSRVKLHVTMSVPKRMRPTSGGVIKHVVHPFV
jgi:hypothetical protein